MKKSQFKGIILALIFGPFGLFYSSIRVAVALVVAASIIGFFSSEVPLSLWPISIIVSLFTVRRHNISVEQELQGVSTEAKKVGQGTLTANEEEGRAELVESRKRVAERLSRMADKIGEEEAANDIDRPGFVDGEHFTAYVDQVKQLRQEERHEEAIALLGKLIAATESESRESGGASGVAPWYYEQLAIIYRKDKRIADEVAILERYERQSKASGVGPERLAERLTKARAIATSAELRAEREGLEAREADLEAEKSEVPILERDESQPMAPIVGTDKIAEFLRRAGTKKAETEGKEAELVDFRIPAIQEHAEGRKTSNKLPGTWVKPGKKAKVGKFSIQQGFFYVGGQLKGLGNYDYINDPSLIDPTLRLDVRSPDYAGDQMNYWPSYSTISPQSRAAYIEWLASDRSDPGTYIGYIFLYFYGIERRLLVDDKDGMVSEEERTALIQELKRQLETWDGVRRRSTTPEERSDFLNTELNRRQCLPENSVQDKRFTVDNPLVHM